MTWRANLRPARLGNASFLIEGSDAQIGRNTQVHEYPLRDRPYVEDLGRRARRFSLEAYVIGAEYMLARDRLIAELERPGPKTLVHPYLGEMRVAVVDSQGPRESTKEGGMARFFITVVEAGELTFPAADRTTAAAVTSTSTPALSLAKTSFAERFNVHGFPSFVSEDASARVRRLAAQLADISKTVSTLPEPMTSFVADLEDLSTSSLQLVGSPAELADNVGSLIERLRSIARAPSDALSILRQLFGFESDAAPYWIARFDQAARLNVVPGIILTGASSGATAVALAEEVFSRPITHINRAERSNDPANAYWTKTNLTPGDDPAANPLGTQTRSLTATAAAGTHVLSRDFVKPASVEQWRVTAWVAPGTTNFARITISAPGGHSYLVSFNLATGALSGQGQAGTEVTLVGAPEIVAAGLGYRRISLTISATAAVVSLTPSLRVLNAASSDNYAGAGESLLFAGLMIEQLPTSADTSVYVPTTGELRGNGAGYYVLGRLSGAFQDNEDLDLSGTTQSVANGIPTLNGPTTEDLDREYRALAAADQRAQLPATASRTQQLANQDGFTTLVQQLAIVEAIGAAAAVDFDSVEAAAAVRDELVAEFDRLCESATSDALYDALVDVRTACVRDIQARSADLARIVQLTLADPLPAIALAYRLYGDASLDEDVIRRNGVRDPLFVPSGAALEVLSDA